METRGKEHNGGSGGRRYILVKVSASPEIAISIMILKTFILFLHQHMNMLARKDNLSNLAT